jgi:Flp pilus assembly protein TadG
MIHETATNTTRHPLDPSKRGRFRAEESGSVTVFAIYMVLIMLMVGGIGVDLMRHEMDRTRIQSVADRAVLAAADLDQPLDPSSVVEDYFAKSGMSDYLASIQVDEGLNFRTVTVDATSTMKTQFIKKLGVPEMIVPARAQAEERVNKVEISLVLDISGSMSQNNKIDNLHDAAGVFLDTVLRPETRDLISVSVIPYTAQVNAGPAIFNELNVDRLHPYSECVDFETSDFNTVPISQTQSYAHMQHFEAGWSHSGSTISNPGCPKQSYEEITAFSQDAAALKAQINQFRPRANTSIHLGMKWGVAMLDPAFRPINQAIPSDVTFNARPAEYSDMETLKTVILMTDGENVPTERIASRYYANRNHRDHWNKYSLHSFLYYNVYSRDSYKYNNDVYNWRYTKYTAAQADSMLQNICDAAKAQNIVIWSIGFEVGNHGADVMRNCASSPSHFFRVEGVEISEAFEAIARQINQLRLTL